MVSRISHTTFDCHDAFALSTFWKQVLGFADVPDDPNEPGDEECMIIGPGGEPRLLFVEVPEGKGSRTGRTSIWNRPTGTATTRSSGSSPSVRHRCTTSARRMGAAGWSSPIPKATSSASSGVEPSANRIEATGGSTHRRRCAPPARAARRRVDHGGDVSAVRRILVLRSTIRPYGATRRSTRSSGRGMSARSSASTR